ncbi:hypothetical protein SEVIR_4G213150v4 [Setaria viridis]|nr:uncharacterized protein LOC117851547 [Setaria viridis]
MDHHCHCPPVDHAHYSPSPCEQQDSSWNTPDHCHPPCPPCPPPYGQQDYSWPSFQPAPFPRTWSSSSSDADVPSCTTVRVETPPAAAATGDEAPLLESKVHGGDAAAGPSGTEVLFGGLLFWAVIAGFIYWYWFC